MSTQKLDAVIRDIVRSQDADYQGFGGYFKILDSLKKVEHNLRTATDAFEVAWTDPAAFGKRQAD